MTECAVEIMQPIAGMLACEASGTEVSCYDGSDGTATVTPIGGMAPYSYSWSNGDTTQSITGLAAGTYTVTVTDANGRGSTSCEVEITQPIEALSCMALVNTHVSVNGGSDGMATVTSEGGTMPYEYLWDNGETDAMAEALDAGVHTVMVTDANGCMTECAVEITQPDPDSLPDACNTAYARYSDNNRCFTEDGFDNWGWTNYLVAEGDYTMDLYAGAAHCNFDNEKLAGEVTVAYHNNEVIVSIELSPGWVMSKTQLYIGTGKYPDVNGRGETVSPGQYPYKSEALDDATTYEFDPVDANGEIYVIVHVDVCKKATSIVEKVSQTKVTAYPMTFRNDLNLSVEIPYDSNLKIEMFDVNGRCVMEKRGMSLKQGKNDVHLNVSNLAPDMYFLILNTGREKIIKKVMSRK